jgi:PQQ-like domain
MNASILKLIAVTTTGISCIGFGQHVIETVNLFPYLEDRLPHPNKVILLPSRSTADFGHVTKALPKQVSGAQNRAHQNTILEPLANQPLFTACGPAPQPNEMNCYNTLGGELLARVAIPGNVTSTPIFHDNSWIIGTSKGFLLRTVGMSLKLAPYMNAEQTAFWGGSSREMMRTLKDRLTAETTRPSAQKTALKILPAAPPAWMWYYVGSSEFEGTPIVVGNVIAAQNSQQTLNAFDLSTGKISWTVRLAPETPLRLKSRALATDGTNVVAGTNEGVLMGISPTNGDVLWRHLVISTRDDSYKAIVHTPLLQANSVYFSNAESMTQRLNITTKVVDWSYPIGSIANLKLAENSAFIGGSDGSILRLDANTGALKWKSVIDIASPIASLVVSGKHILASNKRGMLSLLSSETGKVIWTSSFLGEVVGEFFENGKSQCLSYSQNALRCFEIIGR